MGTIPLFPIGLASDKSFYLKDRLRKGRVCSEAAIRKGFACVNPHHFRVQELPKNEVRNRIQKLIKIFFLSQLAVIRIRGQLSSDHPDSLLFVRIRILLSNIEGVEHT